MSFLRYQRCSHLFITAAFATYVTVAYAAQTASTATSKPACDAAAFEVATIKPVAPEGMHSVELRVYPGGHLIIRTVSLVGLIHDSYGLQPWQLSMPAKWMEQESFDIEARAPESCAAALSGGEHANSGLQNPVLRRMLAQLLQERLHLKFHKESKTGTIYLLQRNGKPIRLIPVQVSYTPSVNGESTELNDPYPTGDLGLAEGAPIAFHKTSMPQLADFLSGYVEKAPVIDQTGLAGYFTYRSSTVLTGDDFRSGVLASVFLSILPEAGLKLEKSTGLVERMVVDSATEPETD